MAQKIIHSSPTAKESAANNFDIFIIHSVKVFFFLCMIFIFRSNVLYYSPIKEEVIHFH